MTLFLSYFHAFFIPFWYVFEVKVIKFVFIEAILQISWQHIMTINQTFKSGARSETIRAMQSRIGTFSTAMNRFGW